MAKRCLFALMALLAATLFIACPNPAQPNASPAPTATPGTMYSFSLASDGSGTVSQSPEGTSFAEGTTITVSTAPASGFRLDGWKNGDGTTVSSSNPYSFVLAGNTALTAVHVPDIVSLNGSVTGSGTLSLSPSGASGATIDQDIANRTVVTITANPDANNQFLRWEGDLSGYDNPKTITLTKDTTFVAVFAPSATATYTVDVAAEPAAGGSVSPGSGRYASGEVLNFTAIPNGGYLLREWEDHSAANPRAVTLSGDMSITASFGRTHTIRTSATNGTIALNPNKAQYFEGETVTVTETPNEGYAFTGWTGGLTGKDPSETITVGTSNIAIGAKFVGRWTILVHFAVDNNIDYTFEESAGIVSNYLATLESVEAADTDDVLDIMLLMDAYASTANFTDGYYKLSGGAFSAETPHATGEINSGAVATTTAFVDWAYENSSGKRVMYSVFNHGSGFDDQTTAGTYGIGFDDSADDCLTHNELAQTTAYIKAKAGKNLDLFYTYACLMGGVELAWEVRDSADILLCSEEVFPAEAWSYEALASIVATPAMSGASVARAFCDDAYAFFSDPEMGRSFTLAAIDLSEMQPLYDAIDSFAESANSWIGGSASRAKSMDMAATSSLAFNSPYYTDLGVFMDMVDEHVGGFSSRTTAVRNAIDDAVVYKRSYSAAGTSGEINYDDISGISIFHNLWLFQNSSYTGVTYLPATYRNVLAFGATNSWTDYAQTMYASAVNPGTPAQDQYEPDDSVSATNTSMVVGGTQTHTFNNGTVDGDWDYIEVNLTGGQSYVFQTGLATTATYPALALYREGTGFVAVSLGFNPIQKFSYTPMATGTYYLVLVDNYNLKGDSTVSFRTGSLSESRILRKPSRIPEKFRVIKGELDNLK